VNYTELKKAIRGYVENDFPTITFADSVTTYTSDDQLATFVKQAEQRIFNAIQPPILRKNVTGVLDEDNPYLSCPPDFLSPFSLAVYSYAQPTGTGTSGAYTVTVSAALNIQAGQFVFGTGIATNAQVVSISGTTVTLNIANTATVSGVLTFQSKYFYLLNKDVEFIREAYPPPQSIGRPRHYALFGPTVNGATITTDISIIVGPTPDIDYKAELHYFYYPESIVDAGTTWLGDNFDSVLLYGALQEAYTFIKAEPDMMARVDSQYKEALALIKQLSDGKDRRDTYRDVQVRYPVR
jgi:hypothetical protein